MNTYFKLLFSSFKANMALVSSLAVEDLDVSCAFPEGLNVFSNSEGGTNFMVSRGRELDAEKIYNKNMLQSTGQTQWSRGSL